MINFLQKKALKKALSQKGRKAEYCRLSSLKSVAVVMDISTDSSNTEAKAIFDKFFEGVSIDYIAFDFCKKSRKRPAVIPEGVRLFSRKDMKWTGLPKSEAFYAFAGYEYDMLIDVSSKSFCSEYFVVLSKAGFKIGRKESAAYADMVINSGDGGSLAQVEFAEAVVNYLSCLQ